MSISGILPHTVKVLVFLGNQNVKWTRYVICIIEKYYCIESLILYSDNYCVIDVTFNTYDFWIKMCDMLLLKLYNVYSFFFKMDDF